MLIFGGNNILEAIIKILEGKIISQSLGRQLWNWVRRGHGFSALAKSTLSSNQMELKTGTWMVSAKVHLFRRTGWFF